MSDINDQIFTHIDPDTGEDLTIAVTFLRKACNALVKQGITKHIARTPIERENAMIILKRRGIERPRLRAAYKTKQYQPLMYAELNGYHLLVDGSHSYLAMYLKRIPEASAFVIPEVVWRDATIEGLPKTTEEELLASHSGHHPALEKLIRGE